MLRVNYRLAVRFYYIGKALAGKYIDAQQVGEFFIVNGRNDDEFYIVLDIKRHGKNIDKPSAYFINKTVGDIALSFQRFLIIISVK